MQWSQDSQASWLGLKQCQSSTIEIQCEAEKMLIDYILSHRAIQCYEL